MSIESTIFKNINFAGYQLQLPSFSGNFWNMPAAFGGLNLWNNWNNFSLLGNFNTLGIWNNGFSENETANKDFYSDFWKSFKATGNNSVNFKNNDMFRFSWSDYKVPEKTKFQWDLQSSSPSTGISYSTMSRDAALKAAAADSALERLSGGKGWSISDASFINDIPYARKGTGAILEKVSDMIGEDIVVTSALGTKTSPHVKSESSASHYNRENPKLDLGGGLTLAQAQELKTKLDKTGMFALVEVESDGSTAHLDVQIAESAFKSLDTLA